MNDIPVDLNDFYDMDEKGMLDDDPIVNKRALQDSEEHFGPYRDEVSLADEIRQFSTATCVILWPGLSMSDLDIERTNFANWCDQHPEFTDWGFALMEYRHGKEA